MQRSAKPDEIEALWEYDDPKTSERRFRAALDGAAGDQRLELLTQIARTYSIRREFEAAHATLDVVESQLAFAGPRPAVRYLLERGRTFNSAGVRDEALLLFHSAWERAQSSKLEGLAVDAAHMLAIVHRGSSEGIEWNAKGLDIARRSKDAKARALIPAMLNNGAWDLHQMGRFDEALSLFHEAEREWRARGMPTQIQIARWSVARCLRSLGRYEEALEIQRDLEAEHSASGTVDGYVFEEIAENLSAVGKSPEARSYFRRAYDELSKDAGFAETEASRLKSLQDRGVATA